ncbi:UNVERIFIED_CONTAM: Seven transmembrane protein 1 [Sesamum radiatum]|uniref:Seven transmembrane protein 1 n=1 Tax=Sesamum radiatum TaxID=300843 RepID=A0AAW2P6D3_SESRA
MKPVLQNSLSYCVKEQKPCIGWVDKYFKDCLCNVKDELSFGFGLVSLVCWGVAEIPQIITNFRTKSGHGISFCSFLLGLPVANSVLHGSGKIVRSIFCKFLRKQTEFGYHGQLYTTTTVVLVLQSIYYDYVRKWRNGEEKESDQEVEDLKKPLKTPQPIDSAIPIPNGTRRATSRREAYYYTSARSMAGSTTPPIRSYLWPVKSGPSAVGIDNNSSSDDEDNPTPSRQSVSRPKPIPDLAPYTKCRIVGPLLWWINFVASASLYGPQAGYGAFLATSINMPRETKALMQAYVGLTGRKLLQEHGSESVYGQWLGWMMAAIYMGGRLPQIWLNIRRGNVEGLNPLMFVFALAANATYVASILVRSTAWDKIKANMPWLLDAMGCVLLDLFVLSQGKSRQLTRIC